MIVLITPPSVEPVTLLQAKLHLKLITNPADASVHPDDAKVQDLISVAREQAEQFCNRAFAEAGYEARGCGFDVALFGPAGAITSVKYLDTDGAEQTLTNTVYELNASLDRLRLKIGQSWPAVYARDDAVRVVFSAGDDPADVPRSVWAAMLLIVGTLYDNRASLDDRQTFALPLRVQDLLMPYRVGMGV